ncbi:hypothetical protein Hypma_003283 [Hypsizygus marmoreus]|uniref:Uncharacterized protein n=1 Tax=Hypsizygus marmoreus TaxID=39966 RepID=A0A369K176_HYPMA|nr:hypothetical protein Hypma_003283 [Hypsizygus marmoreus]
MPSSCQRSCRLGYTLPACLSALNGACLFRDLCSKDLKLATHEIGEVTRFLSKVKPAPGDDLHRLYRAEYYLSLHSYHAALEDLEAYTLPFHRIDLLTALCYLALGKPKEAMQRIHSLNKPFDKSLSGILGATFVPSYLRSLSTCMDDEIRQFEQARKDSQWSAARQHLNNLLELEATKLRPELRPKNKEAQDPDKHLGLNRLKDIGKTQIRPVEWTTWNIEVEYMLNPDTWEDSIRQYVTLGNPLLTPT